MSYTELYALISNPWASVKEIRCIARCGRDTAIKIRNEIINDIRKHGKEIPNTKVIYVPTKNVIEKLNLDVNYIIEMTKLEQDIGKTNHASI